MQDGLKHSVKRNFVVAIISSNYYSMITIIANAVINILVARDKLWRPP